MTKKNYFAAANKIYSSIFFLKEHYHREYGCATRWTDATEQVFLLNCEVQIRSIVEKYEIVVSDKVYLAQAMMRIETSNLFGYMLKYQQFPQQNSTTIMVQNIKNFADYLQEVDECLVIA